MSKLTFLTSFTYGLTPSTSNLVNVEVQMIHEEVCLEVELNKRMAEVAR